MNKRIIAGLLLVGTVVLAAPVPAQAGAKTTPWNSGRQHARACHIEKSVGAALGSTVIERRLVCRNRPIVILNQRIIPNKEF